MSYLFLLRYRERAGSWNIAAGLTDGAVIKRPATKSGTAAAGCGSYGQIGESSRL